MSASGGAEENVVVVAVRAEREISKSALAWALTHIVHPGDVVTLLAVLSDQEGSRGGWKRWLRGFPRFRWDARGRGGRHPHRQDEEQCQISASCSQMALQIDGQNEVKVSIKVVGSGGLVAEESNRIGAKWIVLDKQLKQEVKHCLEELQCNIVVMKKSRAKVLRLNLGGVHKLRPSISASYSAQCSTEKLPDDWAKHPTPLSSPQSVKASSSLREEAALSTIGGASTIFAHEHNPIFQGFHNSKLSSQEDVDADEDSDSDCSRGRSPDTTTFGLGFHTEDRDYRDYSGFHQEPGSYLSPTSSAAPAHSHHNVHWVPRNHISEEIASIKSYRSYSGSTRPPPPTTTRRTLRDELHVAKEDSCAAYYTSEVREAVSLFGSSPSNPPPLCSLCRHKAPIFGKPPRRFRYRELEDATDGFSDGNFLGEGGYGCVHRGVLGDGQVVAVKQMKGSDDDGRGDCEFLSEVESLSRPQHRNIVMLVGFCIEGTKRVLVYEYICNGSLDIHLHGQGEKMRLDWQARFKIAVGAARGLRYLHEDCRVGFVIHGDIRPNNILLTHDFEPMVGDFSLTRWHTEGSICGEIHAVGSFGYLAPEYIEYGLLTEKADVYSFGVVLLELVTGRRSMDTTQPKGQQFLVDWARPLLTLSEEGRTVALDRFLDPRLDRDEARYFSTQLRAMSCAASMCLRRDPQARPSMSKVLRVLEGDVGLLDSAGFDNIMNSVGSRSSRMSHLMREQEENRRGSVSLRFSHDARSLFY